MIDVSYSLIIMPIESVSTSDSTPASTPALNRRCLTFIILFFGWLAAAIGGSMGILVSFDLMYRDTIEKTAVRADFYIRDVFPASMRSGQPINSGAGYIRVSHHYSRPSSGNRVDDYIWVNAISTQPSGNISCVNIPYKRCESDDDCIQTEAQLLSLNPPIVSGFIAPDIYPTGRPFCSRIYFNIKYLSIDDGFLSPGIMLGYLFVCLMVLFGVVMCRCREHMLCDTSDTSDTSHSVSPPSGDMTSPELPPPSTTIVSAPEPSKVEVV